MMLSRPVVSRAFWIASIEWTRPRSSYSVSDRLRDNVRGFAAGRLVRARAVWKILCPLLDSASYIICVYSVWAFERNGAAKT